MIKRGISDDPVRLEGNDVREAAVENDLRPLQSHENSMKYESATWAVNLNLDVLFGSERANRADYSLEMIHYLLQRVACVQSKGGQSYQPYHHFTSYTSLSRTCGLCGCGVHGGHSLVS